MMNIFEKACKEKIRFNYKGLITVEDLWDLNVTDLDLIYKQLNSQQKASEEESLLGTQTIADTLLNAKIKIVKYIVAVKLVAEQNKVNAKSKADKKQKIMEILASKQDNELQEKSQEELEEMLNSL